VSSKFIISASALKTFELCPRSWYLKHHLRAPDDQGAGGLYLARGNDFDTLVQRYIRDGAVGDASAPKLANRQLAAARRSLPAPGTAEVQFSYRVDVGDFVVQGKPDLRRPPRDGVAWIGDTKTTSDRGEGVGAAADRPAYALTDETLRADVQFRLYAWCECQLDRGVDSVAGTWTYVSKADAPKSWDVDARIGRSELEAWFDSYVRPTVAKMRAYADAALTADQIPANPDSCRRCFVTGACPGPYAGPNVYGLSGPLEKERGKSMAFNIKKLRANVDRSEACTPVDAVGRDLTAALEASVAAVAINRPGPVVSEADTLDVTTVEGPGAAELAVEPTPLADRFRALAAALDALANDARALAEEVGS